MRIAISQKKKGWGGQAAHAWGLALGLRARGHEVFLLAQPGSVFSRKAGEAGFPVREIQFYGTSQIPAALRMAGFLRANRIELVHCHDAKDHQMACFARKTGYVRRIVRTKHNTHPLRNALSRLLFRQFTSHVISVSDAVKRSLTASRVPLRKITTIHNFVDTARFAPGAPPAGLRRRLSIPPDFHVVGTVGRLHESKGIADFIGAVPLVLETQPKTRFLFIGSQPGQWRRAVEEARIRDCCVFTGHIEDVADYLRLLDVAVFPSRDDAFSLAALEALSAGRAVVATRVGGIPEVVHTGRTGLMVDAHRPDLLAGAIVELLENPALRARFGANGRMAATTVFTEEKYLTRVEQVYRTVLSSKR